jgi:hypothetical protein
VFSIDRDQHAVAPAPIKAVCTEHGPALTRSAPETLLQKLPHVDMLPRTLQLQQRTCSVIESVTFTISALATWRTFSECGSLLACPQGTITRPSGKSSFSVSCTAYVANHFSSKDCDHSSTGQHLQRSCMFASYWLLSQPASTRTTRIGGLSIATVLWEQCKSCPSISAHQLVYICGQLRLPHSWQARNEDIVLHPQV